MGWALTLAVPLAGQLTPNPKFRDTAVIGAFRELNPGIVHFTTVYRTQVGPEEDLSVVRGGAPVRHWAESGDIHALSDADVLGIFVLSRTDADVAHTILIDANSGSASIEVLLAGPDGVVIGRKGDYGMDKPRLRYFLDARTKAYYGKREFAPGHTVIEGLRLVVSEAAAATYTANACGSGVQFGPAGAYALSSRPMGMWSAPGCAVQRRDERGSQVFVVENGALENYADARPRRVEINGMPDVSGLNETIGPWQLVDGQLWFGLTFYDGEGLTGVGGFGWFDTATESFEVLRPREMAEWSASAILVEEEAVWLGMMRRPEGMEYSGGLLRWDREAGTARRWPEVPLVRELRREGERLLVGGQGGGAVVEGDRVEVYVTDVDRAGRMRLSPK